MSNILHQIVRRKSTGEENNKADRYIVLFSWFIVLFVVVLRYTQVNMFSPVIVGDESTYTTEVDYFNKFGYFKALAQGTSFLYTLLIYITSCITTFNYLVSTRILSGVFYFIDCYLFLRCFRNFEGISRPIRYTGMVIFATLASKWMTRGTPDLIETATLLIIFDLTVSGANNKKMILAGILLFAGFAIKPVNIFAIPGFLLFILARKGGAITMRTKMIQTGLMICSFLFLFFLYHIPGYKVYNKLMLEDKNHYYQGEQRINSDLTWVESNVYFEIYNINHKPNKWMLTPSEVEGFKKEHPEINLNLGWKEYVAKYTGHWASNVANRIILLLPYSIQGGFFFAKWTVINSYFHSTFIISLIALLLIAFMYISEYSFVKHNLLLLCIPLSYYVLLSLYLIPQLEDNWLLYCLPFLGLPVARFVGRYVPAIIFLALQLIYIIIR